MFISHDELYSYYRKQSPKPMIHGPWSSDGPSTYKTCYSQVTRAARPQVPCLLMYCIAIEIVSIMGIVRVLVLVLELDVIVAGQTCLSRLYGPGTKKVYFP